MSYKPNIFILIDADSISDDEAPPIKKTKRGKKNPWSEEENEILKKHFSFYLSKRTHSLHKEDIERVTYILPGRTVPQVRTKLNNMRLGKSKSLV